MSVHKDSIDSGQVKEKTETSPNLETLPHNQHKSALSTILSFIWKPLKLLLGLVRFTLLHPLILAALLLSGAVFYGLARFNLINPYTWPLIGNLFPKPLTTIDVTVSPPSPIAKLFTGFAIARIIDIEYDDPEKGIKPEGYCYHEYEVAYGYRNLSGAFFEKHLSAACAGRHNDLPVPNILSVNPISSEAMGTYTRAKCEEWDLKPFIRERKIGAKLAEQKQLSHLQERGQKILGSYLRIYCSLPEVRP